MMLLPNPDTLREWSSRRPTYSSDFIRVSVSTGIGWVGWMMLFSSTMAIGGWVKRYAPYGRGL
jgi:hypothetical protein